jgi:hypothetical protein
MSRYKALDGAGRISLSFRPATGDDRKSGDDLHRQRFQKGALAHVLATKDKAHPCRPAIGHDVQ